MYSEKDQKGEPLYYNINTMDLYDKKKGKTETVKFKTSRCKPCIQTISMSIESYQYMMSTPTNNISANHWKRMSENQRIAEHLKEKGFEVNNFGTDTTES